MHYETHIPAFLRFLREEEGARPNTLKNHRQEIERLAASRVPLERGALLQYAAEGRRGPVAPATRNWRLMTVRRFIRFLVDRQVLAHDPTADIGLLPVPRKRRAPVSLKGLRHGLLRLGVRGAVGARDRALVTLFFQTGLRLSEVHGLQLAQVDLRAGLLVGVIRKGGHVADIHLNEDAILALRAWLDERGRAPGPLFPGSDPTGTLARRTIQKRLERFGELAGVVGSLHPHRLRHTYATELLRAGSPTEIIRILMDHKSLETTQLYLHAGDADLRRAVQRLPRLQAQALRDPNDLVDAPQASQMEQTHRGNLVNSSRQPAGTPNLRSDVENHEKMSTVLDPGDRPL